MGAAESSWVGEEKRRNAKLELKFDETLPWELN